MRIVCAPDSFKESMTSLDAARAMTRGIGSVDPTIVCDLVPMADGGEGTAEALVAALHGEWVQAPCHDPLNRPTTARFGFVPDRQLAIIEVAEAIGLATVPPEQRDPWTATSRGAGDLIRAALDRGANTFVIGLGGSATNDAGAGMLTALGARLLDRDGTSIPDGARGLPSLDRVDLDRLDERLRQARFQIAVDVSNPLLGRTGASAVFGAQKGALSSDIPSLDAALARWADVVEPATDRPVRDLPGAGSAGGLGAAFTAFTEATLASGVDLVMDAVGLRDRIIGADWVFTGEGGIDAQTAAGKTPWGVAQASADAGVRSILFGGRVSDDAYQLVNDMTVAVVPILPRLTDLTTALQQGPENLERAAATVTRLLLAPRPGPERRTAHF